MSNYERIVICRDEFELVIQKDSVMLFKHNNNFIGPTKVCVNVKEMLKVYWDYLMAREAAREAGTKIITKYKGALDGLAKR